MNMKKFLAGGLAATMALTLTACGQKPTEPTTPADPGADAPSTTEPVKTDLAVGVMYYNYADTYIATVRGELSAKLDELGIKHSDQDGNNNQTTQTEQVQNEVTKGSEMLIVNVVNTASDDAANGILDKAKTADLPVLFFNREVSDEVVKGYDKAAFVGTVAPEAGHMQGEMIGDYLLADYDKYDLNGDGKISYVLFKGEQGNAEAEARTQFAVEDANKKLTEAGKPELEFYDANNSDKYLVDQKGAWSSTASQEYMATILSAYNDTNKNMVELVICNNDGMAEGAVTALNTSGYNDGGEKAVPVFGVDATSAAVSLIADKKMAGTIKQDATGMAQCIADITANVAAGKDMMDGIADKYRVDEGVNKVRIPYQIYLGE